jgi:hypothetical protein
MQRTEAGVKPQIIKSRLAEMEGISLKSGAHSNPWAGMCAMELCAYVAGRPHSDHPPCVSPVIGAFGRTWNDSLRSDADRDRLLKPLIPELIGTATTPEDDERRAWMATDWLVRVHTPAWLRLAGLVAQAERLEALSELNPTTTPPILPALKAIREDACKAGAAAWDAARAAAWDAARDAAWDALKPTVEKLQASAQDLLRRMAAVGRVEPVVIEAM